MATAAVIGLTAAGKRLLSSSFYSNDLNDKLFSVHDLGAAQLSATSTRNAIIAKKPSNFPPGFPSNRHTQSVKALKEHVDTSSAPSTAETCCRRCDLFDENENENDFESSLEVLILLQRSALEKQWNLSCDPTGMLDVVGGAEKKIQVIRSGVSARQRRSNSRRAFNQSGSAIQPGRSKYDLGYIVNQELLQQHLKGYVKGSTRKDLLSHDQVIHLSTKINAGLSLEKHKSR